MAFDPFAAFRLQIGHEEVYGNVEPGYGFSGQMSVNGCGLWTLVSEKLLNGAKVNAVFQKRCGIASPRIYWWMVSTSDQSKSYWVMRIFPLP